jgi:hypothetical protein
MKVRCEIRVNLGDIYQFLSPAERFLISFLYSGPFFRSLNHVGRLVSLQRPLLHYSLPSARLFSAILSGELHDWDMALIFTANITKNITSQRFRRTASLLPCALPATGQMSRTGASLTITHFIIRQTGSRTSPFIRGERELLKYLL